MDKWKIALIGYFRVSKILTFEVRPSAQPFLWKWVLFVSRMKNHFHIKGWTLNLVLIQRTEGTRKWPINSCLTSIFSLWVNLVSYETKREYKRLIFNDKASFHAPLWLWPSMSKASDSLPKRQQQQQFLSVPLWYILPLKHYNSIK